MLRDWQLIGIVWALAGIVTSLLLLGEAIPYLRDSVTKEQDMERPKGINVSKLIKAYDLNLKSFFFNLCSI